MINDRKKSTFRYRPESTGTTPPVPYSPYISNVTRSPAKPLVDMPQTVSETTGPQFGRDRLWKKSSDLGNQFKGEAIGERILVWGKVRDDLGRPVPNTLIEVWQANAAGRYRHPGETYDAPLDPNFSGRGAVMSDDDGIYKFRSIKPGAYPWKNNWNAWRPSHIHFSVFGPAFATRLITQMYFPGDPLLEFDAIFNCVPDELARQRLVALIDWDNSEDYYALAYRFDIVLRGREETPWEDGK